MVWSPDMNHSYAEAAKVAPIVVQYMRGRVLDVGPGSGKVWPSVIGIDQQPGATDICGGLDDLAMFADGSFDAVFSSHMLEDVPEKDVPGVLAAMWRILKVGGNLILYLPDTESEGGYPHIGDPECNVAHRWEPNRLSILKLMEDVGSWTCIVDETRMDGEEYSFLQVFRKDVPAIDGNHQYTMAPWQRNPEGKKRALLVRYAAIGDAIVASSVFPLLKRQGFHLTMNTTPKTQEILRENPFIDEWMIQDTDFVPNHMLGPYWSVLAKRYDKVVNLSESVEGALLALPGRLNHSYSHETRAALYDDVNYLEQTHRIAGVPLGDYSGSRFYPTKDEVRWAELVVRNMRESCDGGPVIVWCVNGSSPHKVYPWVAVVTKWLTERPCKIVLYGDAGIGKQLAEAIIENVRKNGGRTDHIFSVADKWSIRQSLTFARFADVVVGPETGPMNAVAMEDVPKVLYLSHSSADNLTKHWINTEALIPDSGRAPCFPCHQLHFGWEHCHQHPDTHAALCASAVAAETVFKAIARAVGAIVKEAA